MKACAPERAGCVLDRYVVDQAEPTGGDGWVLRVADAPFLWGNLFQWDYLLSRPLED